MKIQNFILLTIILFIFFTNSLFPQTLKVISKSWYSTEMVTDYIEFIKNDRKRYTCYSYGSTILIKDFRNFLNKNKKSLEKIKQGVFTKKDADVNIAIIINDDFGQDTIAIDNFLRYILINSEFYQFDWNLLTFIKYKLAFETNNEINQLYLFYYNNKREDQ